MDEKIKLVLPEIVAIEAQYLIEREFSGRSNTRQAAVLFKAVIELSEKVSIEETRERACRSKGAHTGRK